MINDRITTGRGRAFKPARGSESGASLVFALFLMLFLTLISFSLVMLISHEVKSSTKLYLSQQALYAAEAGVERKIAELKEEYSSDIALTDFFGAQYEVSVSAAGTDQFAIVSKGYVPNKASAKEARAVQVTVLVTPGAPEHALGFSGTGTIGANSTIFGTIRSNSIITIGSNVKITESSLGKGDASVFTAHNPQDSGVTSINLPVGASLEFLVPGQFMRCRNNSLVAPDSHARQSPDGTDQIFSEARVKATNAPTIVENDNSPATDPLDIPSADLDALLETAINVTTSNYISVINGGDLNQPWVLSAEDETGIFSLLANMNWNPDGGTYNFTRGVEFRSNSSVGAGEGTVMVSSGTSDYGIEINSNLGSTELDKVRLNLLVVDGEWALRDIIFNSNIYLSGYVYGSADVEGESNVEIEGIVEAGGDLVLNPKVTITYSDDIPMELPWKEGFSGLVEIISWQEVSP
ncbi:MAG: hypothetical protein CVU78_04790 [Elusimicrobia bacterium HGW-Elusimicrobia-2]|nr:MAG: hypothetical protein CVU78_04790 [Elusimicrobia bacterium HGW-Elusimicrobia-2]